MTEPYPNRRRSRRVGEGWAPEGQGMPMPETSESGPLRGAGWGASHRRRMAAASRPWRRVVGCVGAGQDLRVPAGAGKLKNWGDSMLDLIRARNTCAGLFAVLLLASSTRTRHAVVAFAG